MNNLISLLGQEEPEESLEYFDWNCKKLEDGSVIWSKQGKVSLSKSELNKISSLNTDEVSKDKYYIKRIWMLRYINKNIYNRNSSNTTLVVSRDNILEESFNQFMTTFELDLRQAMQIFFVDEIAHDVGGVYREWYSCLFDSIFSQEEGFFYRVDEKSIGKNSYYIPTLKPKIRRENYKEYYEFIGKVVAKAIFDKITIKTNFNLILFKIILRKNLQVEDLKFIDSGVIFLINYNINVLL